MKYADELKLVHKLCVALYYILKMSCKCKKILSITGNKRVGSNDSAVIAKL